MKTMPLAVLYVYSLQHKKLSVSIPFPFRSHSVHWAFVKKKQEMCTELYCHVLYMCVYVYIYIYIYIG